MGIASEESEPAMSQTIEPTTQFIDEPLYEVVGGERKELAPMGALQIVIASELCRQLGNFASNHKLGIVVTEMLFLLNEQTSLQRRPDIAFVSYSRWPAETVDSSAAWDVVPNLAVEVVSPSNSSDEIDGKLPEYLEAGVELVWVIHPISGHVSIYDSPEGSRRLSREDTINGGNVLPGFELSLETLFAVTQRPS